MTGPLGLMLRIWAHLSTAPYGYWMWCMHSAGNSCSEHTMSHGERDTCQN